MKNLLRVVLACLISLSSASVFAALIDGTFTVGGAYEATGGVDLSTATGIDLSTLDSTVIGTSGVDDTDNVQFYISTGLAASASLTSFVPVTGFLSIEGWTLDLTSLTIDDQSNSLLGLSGNGVLSGNTFDATAATWTFTAQSATSYSITVATITTVPVPAAVWLFGTGLIGLVGVARRKA